MVDGQDMGSAPLPRPSRRGVKEALGVDRWPRAFCEKTRILNLAGDPLNNSRHGHKGNIIPGHQRTKPNASSGCITFGEKLHGRMGGLRGIGKCNHKQGPF